MNERMHARTVPRDVQTDTLPMQKVASILDISRIGRFTITSPLTERTHSVLFRATSIDGAPVVAKVSRKGLAAAEDERDHSPLLISHESDVHTAVAKIKNPHLLGLVDAGRESIKVVNGRRVDIDEYPYLVTELAEGTLLDKVERDGPLNASDAARILGELADGVGALHDQGIRHRDIKVSNIYMVGDQPKIGDFGSAVKGRETTALGGGSIGYMAPEINKTGVDPDLKDRVDIFSLGAVAAELFSGKQVLRTDTLDTYEKIFDPETYSAALDRRLSVLPAPLQDPIGNALALNPENRPATPDALVADIEDALRRLPKAAVLYHRPSSAAIRSHFI